MADTTTDKKTSTSRPSLAISDPDELELIHGWANEACVKARSDNQVSDEKLSMMLDLRQRVQKALQKASGGTIATATTAPAISTSTAPSAASEAASRARGSVTAKP